MILFAVGLWGLEILSERGERRELFKNRRENSPNLSTLGGSSKT